jgi:hypothetical protein
LGCLFVSALEGSFETALSEVLGAQWELGAIEFVGFMLALECFLDSLHLVGLGANRVWDFQNGSLDY